MTQGNELRQPSAPHTLGALRLKMASTLPVEKYSKQEIKITSRKQDFPLDALPMSVQEYCRDVARVKETSTSSVALSCLAYIATASAGKIEGLMLDKQGQELQKVHPIFYGVIIAPPSGGKSPAVFEPSSLLNEKDLESTITHASKVKEWNFQNQRKKKKEGDEIAPSLPTHQPKTLPSRYLINKHNLASLTSQILCNCDDQLNMTQGLCLQIDELSQFVHDVNLSEKDEIGPLNTAFGGRWESDTTKYEGVKMFRKTYISFIGGLQNDLINECFTPRVKKTGFLTRFCFAWDEEIHDTSREGKKGDLWSRWEVLQENILHHTPCTAKFSACAVDMFLDFKDVCKDEARVQQSLHNGLLCSFVGKSGYIVPRLALLSAILKEGESGVNNNEVIVTLEDMRFALRAFNYFYYTQRLVNSYDNDSAGEINTPSLLNALVEKAINEGHKNEINLTLISKGFGYSDQWAGKNLACLRKQKRTIEEGIKKELGENE